MCLFPFYKFHVDYPLSAAGLIPWNLIFLCVALIRTVKIECLKFDKSLVRRARSITIERSTFKLNDNIINNSSNRYSEQIEIKKSVVCQCGAN